MAGDVSSTYQDPEVGFCELRPPYVEYDGGADMWVLAQWAIGDHGLVVKTSDGEYVNGAGLPIARHDKEQIPVVHLDGIVVHSPERRPWVQKNSQRTVSS